MSGQKEIIRHFRLRLVFEVEHIPAGGPEEAVRKVFLELARRFQLKVARPKTYRLFIGRAEIGRVTEED